MNKKGVIILLIILVLYVFIMFLLFSNKKNNSNPNNDKQKDIINDKNYKYLIIDNISTWGYSNNEWKIFKPTSIEKDDHFKVYQNNNYMGEFSLQYVSNWNLFNDKDEYVNYDGKIFAYSSNFDIKLIRFNSKNITDDDKDNIKKEYNINNFDYLISDQLVNMDLDGNGEVDQVICLSNIGLDEDDPDDFYNLVVVKLNNNYYKIIDENKNNSNTLEIPVYSLSRIFQYNNDFYIVIEKIEGIDTDSPKSLNILYKFNNDNFIKLIND